MADSLLMGPEAARRQLRADAWSTAEASAARAGVSIRPLESLAETERACALFDQVWQIVPGEPSEVQAPLVRAMAHTGNYAVAAYRGDEMVAASLAFFSSPQLTALHSHITGVRADVAGSGVGAAIKWHQRAWTLDTGTPWVTWTYDPLIARNAWFNIARLGARPVEYLRDFYGLLTDGRNAGQPSDRVLVRWVLDDAAVPAAAAAAAAAAASGPWGGSAIGPMGGAPLGSSPVDAGAAAGAAAGADQFVLLGMDGSGEPVPAAPPPPADPRRMAVAVPPDIEALRVTDPALALRWRYALRDALEPLLAVGGRKVTGFRRPGWYLIDSTAASGSATTGEHA